MEQALELRHSAGDPLDEAQTLCHLAWAHRGRTAAGSGRRVPAPGAATFTDLGNLAQAAAILAQLGESGV